MVRQLLRATTLEVHRPEIWLSGSIAEKSQLATSDHREHVGVIVFGQLLVVRQLAWGIIRDPDFTRIRATFNRVSPRSWRASAIVSELRSVRTWGWEVLKFEGVIRERHDVAATRFDLEQIDSAPAVCVSKECLAVGADSREAFA